MAYQQLSLDQVTVAATGFKGPEGVTVDRDGNVYGGGTDGVIRKLSADGKVTEFARTGGRPAGMALDRQGNLFVCDVGKPGVLKITPKEEAVYVLQSTQNNCVRVAMRKDGTHGKPEVYGENLGGLPDGMAFDAEGYLIITLPMNNRLVVLDPKGKLSVLLDDPEGKKTQGPTNCAFGGPRFDDLYIAHLEADHVAKVHLGRRAHRLSDRRYGRVSRIGG